MRPKFVEIEWVDILATSGWEKPEEVDPTRCWMVRRSGPVYMHFLLDV